ncbi:MAG: hypothetical protein F4185_07495 [Chloroflexi bacterium]|nr:hypothetical protein [Chloroflexota bacterium]MYA50379.1 hypothetical protein [Chloroflexota bacterium]MYF65696.1 hypothetical protein [Chloroflexota bacterium]MYK35057.1 hypothetical protein [Chloroflexota bacterium]
MEIYYDLTRYGHIFSGILWIGLLYFYNFVQAIALPRMEASARPHYQISILPFSLNVFRWAALSTLIFGLLYIIGAEIDAADAGTGSYLLETAAGNSILIGGILGIIMAYNVWMIIWPNQQKIIAAVRDTVENGTPAPADQPKWARTALLASRTNTMLSIPMLFFMVAARNLPSLWS